jgi:hypothetical protein
MVDLDVGVDLVEVVDRGVEHLEQVTGAVPDGDLPRRRLLGRGLQHVGSGGVRTARVGLDRGSAGGQGQRGGRERGTGDRDAAAEAAGAEL